MLLLPGASAGGPPAAELRVTDCQKAAGGAVLVHSCEVVAGGIKLGDTVRGPGATGRGLAGVWIKGR